MVQKLCERLLRKKKRILRKALRDTAGRRTLEEVQKGLFGEILQQESSG